MSATLDNSMYYTFSTIAQVLAGFIALSGVFVIFQIQEIKRILLLRYSTYDVELKNVVNPLLEGYIEEARHFYDQLFINLQFGNTRGIIKESEKVLQTTVTIKRDF